jgi:O-antigen/teichoic acid export membrane protein
VNEDRQRPNEVKVGVVLSYAVIGLQFAVAMIYTPVMLRLLGQSEYGLYILVASIIGYLGLVSFGLSGAYLRFYAGFRLRQDWDRIARLNGTFLLLFSVIGIAVVFAGTVITLNVEALLGDEFSEEELDTARILFAILVVNLGLTMPLSVFSAYVTAHEKFIFQKSLQIVATAVSPFIVLPLLVLGYGSVGMVLGLTAVNIAVAAGVAIYCRARLKIRFAFRGLEMPLVRDIFGFSSYLFANALVDQINWNVDKFIIGRIQGSVSVAIYGVAAILNMNYIMLSTGISGVLIPRVNRLVASAGSDEEISRLFTRVGRIQYVALGAFLSGFLFFGRSFIEIWAGVNYRNAYWIGVLLMVPVTVPLIQNLGIEIQKAKDLHRFRSWVYLAVAVGNIGLSIPLTQRFGGIGAAAATAIALLVGNVFGMNWYYYTRVGLDIPDFWRQILRVSVGMSPAVILGLVITTTVDLSSIPRLLCFGVVYLAVYMSGVWQWGLNEYERHLFGSVFRRFGARGRRAS